MNLEQFAKTAGVELVECAPEWGGRIGYKAKDSPNCTVAGFRTANDAYKHWLKSTFGKHTANAVSKLLKPSNGQDKRPQEDRRQEKNMCLGCAKDGPVCAKYEGGECHEQNHYEPSNVELSGGAEEVEEAPRLIPSA